MASSDPIATAGDDREQGEGEEEQGVPFNPKRHAHELLRSEGLLAYKCSGCEEYGANIGYTCKFKSCHEFTLHEACATLPDAFQHPFRSDVGLKFRPKTYLRRRCNACSDVVKGYVFETEKRDLRLHPLCMKLPQILSFGGHAKHKLKLVSGFVMSSMTGDLKGKAHTCSVCDSQIDSGGWRYRCEEVACKFYVDLSCAKIDNLGLSNYGIERIAPVSRSRSALATKLIVMPLVFCWKIMKMFLPC
jgi:hypothetical protein